MEFDEKLNSLLTRLLGSDLTNISKEYLGGFFNTHKTSRNCGMYHLGMAAHGKAIGYFCESKSYKDFKKNAVADTVIQALDTAEAGGLISVEVRKSMIITICGQIRSLDVAAERNKALPQFVRDNWWKLNDSHYKILFINFVSNLQLIKRR